MDRRRVSVPRACSSENAAPCFCQTNQGGGESAGCPVSRAVRELYLASDGVDWIVPPNALILPRQYYFPDCEALCTAGELMPALSRRVLKTSKGSLPSVRVVRPAVLSVFAKEEQILRIEDLDPFIALQTPSGTTCLLLVQSPAHDLPVGTVLDFESNLASRYDSLGHWIAAQVESEYSFCRTMGRDLPKPI